MSIIQHLGSYWMELYGPLKGSNALPGISTNIFNRKDVTHTVGEL